MTFPFQPHRSLSDDNALDRQLNDWVAGIDIQLGSETAADALEFHRWASSTLGSDSAATGPVAGTWNRVLRNSAQASSKGNSTMSSATLSSPATGNTLVPPQTLRERTSRLANLAATIALVLAIAVGGWLAMMQLQPNDPEPRFAVLGTPEVAESQTCEVEPMTVDEVMEIVENPYKYAEPSAYGPPNSSPAPWYDDFAEVQPLVSENLSGVLGEEPTESAMQEALPVLDNYLACRENGTMAQALRFVDPFSMQERVTSEFPFYRDEEQVRAFITNWIVEQPGPDQWHDEESGTSLIFEPNRNTDEARTQVLWLGLGFNQVLFLGSNVMDGEGNFLARHDARLNIVDGEQQVRFMRYTLVYSMYTEQWYVVPGMWPVTPRI